MQYASINKNLKRNFFGPRNATRSRATTIFWSIEQEGLRVETNNVGNQYMPYASPLKSYALESTSTLYFGGIESMVGIKLGFLTQRK